METSPVHLENLFLNSITPRHRDQLGRWETHAILSILKTAQVGITPAWIAERLGIPVHVVSDSLESLQICGIVSLKETQYSVDQKELADALAALDPMQITRNYQRFLSQSLPGLLTMDHDRAAFGALTFAIEENHIPLVRQMMKQLLSRISTLSEMPSDEVYNISLVLQPLTERRRRSEMY